MGKRRDFSASFILQLKRYFSYDPVTGIVKHLPKQEARWDARFAGKPAGVLNEGYLRVSFGKTTLYVHQIAFAVMSDFIPVEVDHIDLNRLNNKWGNLRNASRQQNACNCKIRKTNKLKIKGVSWSKSNNCYRMDIQHRSKKYHSYHSTKEQAYQAYCAKSAELHKAFSNVV